MLNDHLLNPVRGYLTLRMFEDARAALDELPQELQITETVIILRFDIYVFLKMWRPARELAQFMAVKLPETGHWWWRWACALRFESSVKAARAVLREGVLLHPCNAGIQYNLACYASLLGDLSEARCRLDNAVKLDPGYKETAASDPDLKPLFADVRQRS